MVRFCVGFSYEQLKPDIVAAAKDITLDVIGAMLLASSPKYTASKLIADYIRLIGGKKECTVVGHDFKTSCVNAALANGTMGYAADIEGGIVNPRAPQHAGAVLVPTGLVMGEREKVDGKAFIASIVLGYDVSARVGEACRTSYSYPHSFHWSAVYGHFGAAALAGHLLGLNERQFTNALGLAGINATGLVNWVTDLTENSRPYVLGAAACNGVRSALLAQLGFGGPPAILDPTKFNIYDAFSGEMHLDRLAKGLGREYWIMNTLGFKPYPGCQDIHTGLDILLGIMQEHHLRSNDIAEVVHRVKKDRAPIIDDNALKSHNAQYMMAVAAASGEIGPWDILEDRRRDPEILDMFGRVKLVGDPELDEKEADTPAVVEVVTKDGRRFTEAEDWPKGAPQRPMTKEELEAKFKTLATTVLSQERAERIMGLVNGLEELEDMSQLSKLLSK
jgi:2-methylcitrate dehydratase PrpD